MRQRAKRVLVIHREEPIAEIASFLLVEEGYDCRAAWGQPEISLLLESEARFDLLFFHVGALEEYPELFDWTVSGSGRDVPMVLMAARQPTDISGAILDRASAFLRVPFDREQLSVVVRKAIAPASDQSSSR